MHVFWKFGPIYTCCRVFRFVPINASAILVSFTKRASHQIPCESSPSQTCERTSSTGVVTEGGNSIAYETDWSGHSSYGRGRRALKVRRQVGNCFLLNTSQCLASSQPAARRHLNLNTAVRMYLARDRFRNGDQQDDLDNRSLRRSSSG